VLVKVRGGDTLSVSFEKTEAGGFQKVRLTGPADFVFEGTISL
jgi:diaminopimelate epimerase